MRYIASLVALATIAIVGCQRDPGRDVKPMSRASSTSASSEIIPLDKVSKSQPAIVGQRVANTELTVTYSRPVARGRALFGGIVPYDAVWNPGADQATAISFTRDVEISGHHLAAGKYSIWMTPRQGAWTVIFSNAGDVYHTPYPGEARDALRFEVAPKAAPPTEVLTFEFDMVEGKDAELVMRWGTVAVPLSIRVP